MPNLTGANGHGVKNYPADDVLREALTKYVGRGLTRAEKLQALEKDMGLVIKRTKLNELEKRLSIPSVRKPPSFDVAEEAVLNEVTRGGPAGVEANGPRFIKTMLQTQGILIPRDTVRKIMLTHFPNGFQARFPGKKGTITRNVLKSAGPWREISGDGHEKLGALALRMDCRSSAALGHLYLDFIEAFGATTVQLTTDMGAEIGWMHAIQAALRAEYAPSLDPEVHPEHVLLKSIHNTVIEALWPHLKKKTGLGIKEIVLQGQQQHIFSPNLAWHRDLFNWIFPPLVQHELDGFRKYWNDHRIRHQDEKTMPSGHVPAHVFENPTSTGDIDCSIEIPIEGVAKLREILTEEVGPRSAHLDWVTPVFANLASDVYAQIGSPHITLDNAWEVFRSMSLVLDTLV
ncbi:hypothetical protein OF83DRAFT_1083382 [Amylostereum chailletii]|nr:hypothetical protein OF83DRAFT_1083382 [Amylostereum chailletii]